MRWAANSYLFRLGLVTTSEVVERLVEEPAKSSVEILEAIQVHRQDIVAVNPWKRRVNQPVIENVAPHVLLEDDDRVEDLAQRGYRMPVQQGLLVYQLVPGGSAEKAGLHGVTTDGTLGDILISADGQKLTDMDDLFRLLDKKQIGDTVNFEVYRGGKTTTVPVKLFGTQAATTTGRRPTE